MKPGNPFVRGVRGIRGGSLFLCALLAWGCGKEETGQPKAAPPPAPAEGKGAVKEPKYPRESPTISSDTLAPKPERRLEEPKAKGPAEPAPAGKEFDEAVEKILTLEQEGQFAEAMQLCREAVSRLGGHPEASALLAISARLRDEKQAAAKLTFAIRKLTSSSPNEAEVARRELLEAGDVALILLSKILRDESGGLALQAAKLLVEARDKRAPQAFVAKLATTPPGPLRTALCDGIKALVDLAGQNVFPALYAIVKDDAAGKNWDIAGVLCAALATRCGGDATKLGQLVGDPAAAETLKAYVAKAIESDDPAMADWARAAAPLVGVLAKGLRGSYFQGTSFEKLLFERLDTQIDFTEKTLPFPEGKAESVSVRWTGYLVVERDGHYMIASEFDDIARAWIDGKLIIEGQTELGAAEQQASVTLRKGFHEMKIEFVNSKGPAQISLFWDGPGFGRRPIAGDALSTLPWKGMRGPEGPK